MLVFSNTYQSLNTRHLRTPPPISRIYLAAGSIILQEGGLKGFTLLKLAVFSLSLVAKRLSNEVILGSYQALVTNTKLTFHRWTHMLTDKSA